jgi:hypothetical protein
MGIAGSQFDLTAFPRTIKAEAAGLVDLSRSQFVDPYGLAGIACACAALAQNGTVELRLPRDDNVRNYLARMNFQTVVGLPNVQPDGALPIVARQTIPTSSWSSSISTTRLEPKPWPTSSIPAFGDRSRAPYLSNFTSRSGSSATT